ncbi:darcynin family protein [Methylobacterium sp. J-077]|uniref:darcynin family protein n=1 Tax=Methylobacterium sp. J-077 TaxID=2836656 RepID=UPI001FBB0B8B|nr:darcynin family protein [Methylobacterium sp. J-077]MCJ2122546.1 darcynin [Methylobacterium sp. J-077]
MSDQTFNPKLTVFMLVKTAPEWLALSIDDRFAKLRAVFEPILRRHADTVKLRFYDAEFCTARVTDLWVWEASDHHAYEGVVEALRETAFWDRWFTIVEIIPAVENAYATNYGRAPLAA